MVVPTGKVESPAPVEVRLHLERVLASTHFRNSRRCQDLLRFVVDHTLDGRLDSLKERVIGQAVFARDAGYDTNQDAVVRNAAAEVRKRLAQYYLETESTARDIRIELPSGTYVPKFHPPELVSPPAVPAVPQASSYNWPMWILTLVAAVALLGWAVTARGMRSNPTELDQFWSPTLAAAAPVQICVGQSRMHYYAGALPDDKTGAPISSSQLQPMRDDFLWYGDSVCMTDIGAYFSLHRKPFRVRGARVTPYAELRGYPLVLIGALNNEWTMRLTEGLRFSLKRGDTPEVRGVVDHAKGSGLAWQVAMGPQGVTTDEDYALVTRVFDPQTEHVVVAAGGITHFGTMGAGDFLTSPSYFREALKSAPADWRRKNIQVVLHVKVVEGTPGPPRVLATHFW